MENKELIDKTIDITIRSMLRNLYSTVLSPMKNELGELLKNEDRVSLLKAGQLSYDLDKVISFVEKYTKAEEK